MGEEERPMYRTRQFAELAGVSVRTLHHYDRVGLLKPRRRTGAGYRLYDESDLERLEQIVAFKFIGLSLKQIQVQLSRDPRELPDALRLQRRVLEEKRRLLDGAIQAIRAVEAALEPGRRPDSALLKRVMEAIEMQTDSEWMMRYYSDEAKAKIEERQKTWTPELQAETSQAWAELIREVEAAKGEDPAGEKAQALARRWTKLVEGFTGGDPEVTAGLRALYADRGNWPAGLEREVAPYQSEAWAFISQAIAAGKREP